MFAKIRKWWLHPIVRSGNNVNFYYLREWTFLLKTSGRKPGIPSSSLTSEWKTPEFRTPLPPTPYTCFWPFSKSIINWSFHRPMQSLPCVNNHLWWWIVFTPWCLSPSCHPCSFEIVHYATTVSERHRSLAIAENPSISLPRWRKAIFMPTNPRRRLHLHATHPSFV